MASSSVPKVRKSFNWDNFLKSRPKAPEPAAVAAPQDADAGPEIVVLDDADKLQQKEAGSAAAAVEYVNLIPRSPSPPPARKGKKRQYTEEEKAIALEEARILKSFAAGVRELKRKDPVKWGTLRESNIQYWFNHPNEGVCEQPKSKAGSSKYLPPDVLQLCREAVEGQIKAGVEVNCNVEWQHLL
jgi:hypothetical protein